MPTRSWPSLVLALLRMIVVQIFAFALYTLDAAMLLPIVFLFRIVRNVPHQLRNSRAQDLSGADLVVVVNATATPIGKEIVEQAVTRNCGVIASDTSDISSLTRSFRATPAVRCVTFDPSSVYDAGQLRTVVRASGKPLAAVVVIQTTAVRADSQSPSKTRREEAATQQPLSGFEASCSEENCSRHVAMPLMALMRVVRELVAPLTATATELHSSPRPNAPTPRIVFVTLSRETDSAVQRVHLAARNALIGALQCEVPQPVRLFSVHLPPDAGLDSAPTLRDLIFAGHPERADVAIEAATRRSARLVSRLRGLLSECGRRSPSLQLLQRDE